MLTLNQADDGRWVVSRDGVEVGTYPTVQEAAEAATPGPDEPVEPDAAPVVASAEPAAPCSGCADCTDCADCSGTSDDIAPLLASAFNVTDRPDPSWFSDPGYTDENTVPVPGYPGKRGHALTIEDDGRVHGHAALWGVCHLSFENECVMAPPSPSGYAHYRLGETVCADGSRVPTGRLTVGTGHAPTDRGLSAAAAAAHYDNTGTAVADVACGEDDYGIWVSGTIRPGATVEQVEALRRSSLSGDWRSVGGQLDMVAALAVNTPGFGIPRYSLAASADRLPVRARREVQDDRTMALVAAGAAPLAALAAAPWAGDIARLEQDNAALRAKVEQMWPHVAPLVASAARDRARTALRAAPEAAA